MTVLAGALAASTRPSPVTASTGSGMASISAPSSVVAADGGLVSNMSRFASTMRKSSRVGLSDRVRDAVMTRTGAIRRPIRRDAAGRRPPHRAPPVRAGRAPGMRIAASCCIPRCDATVLSRRGPPTCRRRDWPSPTSCCFGRSATATRAAISSKASTPAPSRARWGSRSPSCRTTRRCRPPSARCAACISSGSRPPRASSCGPSGARSSTSRWTSAPAPRPSAGTCRRRSRPRPATSSGCRRASPTAIARSSPTASSPTR